MTDWTEFDRQHVWHPYTQVQTAPTPIPIESAEGVYLRTPDGREILDGISSWWVNIHGHSHPRLIAALEKQARTMQQVVFAGLTHEPASRLAAGLAEKAPDGMGRVFFSDDGSTAVEVGMKMAAQYWNLVDGKDRDTFVALEHAYHGDTFGAMAAGGVSVFHERFQPFFCRVARAPSPYPYAFDGGKDPQACVQHSLDGLERAFRENEGRVAALIIEPMLQGAGGMIVWPVEYLRGVRELCDKHRVLLIADEVMTGFGRTGRFFACEHGPIRPDILCLSKGLTAGYLPLATTLCTDEIFDAFSSEDRRVTFFHGHSFTGNSLSCAVALESLALFDDEDRLGRIAEIEALFRRRLEALRSHESIGDVRGIGALAAVEFKEGTGNDYFSDVGPRLAAAFLERDILLRPLGNVLYFLPPYVISDEEIERVFDALDEILASWR